MTDTNFIYELTKATSFLQDRTIGFFKLFSSDTIQLVVGLENTLVKTIHITILGDINVSYTESSEGILYIFENGENLKFIKKDHFGLLDILNKIGKNINP